MIKNLKVSKNLKNYNTIWLNHHNGETIYFIYNVAKERRKGFYRKMNKKLGTYR